MECVYTDSDWIGRGLAARYFVINPKTGAYIADNDGYGYKSEWKAFFAYQWWLRSPERMKIIKAEQEKLYDWSQSHKIFIDHLDRLAQCCETEGRELTPNHIQILCDMQRTRCPVSFNKFLTAYQHSFYKKEVLERREKRKKKELNKQKWQARLAFLEKIKAFRKNLQIAIDNESKEQANRKAHGFNFLDDILVELEKKQKALKENANNKNENTDDNNAVPANNTNDNVVVDNANMDSSTIATNKIDNTTMSDVETNNHSCVDKATSEQHQNADPHDSAVTMQHTVIRVSGLRDTETNNTTNQTDNQATNVTASRNIDNTPDTSANTNELRHGNRHTIVSFDTVQRPQVSRKDQWEEVAVKNPTSDTLDTFGEQGPEQVDRIMDRDISCDDAPVDELTTDKQQTTANRVNNCVTNHDDKKAADDTVVLSDAILNTQSTQIEYHHVSMSMGERPKKSQSSNTAESNNKTVKNNGQSQTSTVKVPVDSDYLELLSEQRKVRMQMGTQQNKEETKAYLTSKQKNIPGVCTTTDDDVYLDEFDSSIFKRNNANIQLFPETQSTEPTQRVGNNTKESTTTSHTRKVASQSRNGSKSGKSTGTIEIEMSMGREDTRRSRSNKANRREVSDQTRNMDIYERSALRAKQRQAEKEKELAEQELKRTKTALKLQREENYDEYDDEYDDYYDDEIPTFKEAMEQLKESWKAKRNKKSK